mmetsp:Transcript_91919/g.163657  ORF Transcript_91919/g.163657 Transcript_91919/m.163657 type:complete len:88 (-) Transcript_91919:250-513(-)
MLHNLAQVLLSTLLQLGKHHGGNFLSRHQLLLALHPKRNCRVAVGVDDLEGQILRGGLLETPTNEALHIEDSLLGVQCCLIFCSLTD